MEDKVALFLIFLVFLPSLGSVRGSSYNNEDLKICEVSPYPYSGTQMEYICIYNPMDIWVSLSSYILATSTYELILKGLIAPEEKMYIAENGSAFLQFMGFWPSYNFSDFGGGRFHMRNSGDVILLKKGDRVVDVVVYGDYKYKGDGWVGDGVSLSQGHILRRLSLRDTNTARDWSNYHAIGQSDYKPRSFYASLEIFPYPDEWREVLRFIKTARQELFIEGYYLDSEEFTNSLLEKLKMGVNVSILLEGNPIGGLTSGEKYYVHKLWKNGARIRFMINDPERKIYDRYAFIHSKLIIKDGSEILVATENFDDRALTPCGNRGYGVIVKNQEFATYLRRMFLRDFAPLQDIREYGGEFKNVKFEKGEHMELRRKNFRSVNLSARIYPVISPDFSMEIFKSFITTQKNLRIEAPYIGNEIWEMVRNKTTDILVEKGNFPRFQGKRHYISHLHGKLIIGDTAILVGSMNLDLFSAMNNREVSLIIESREAVKYFLKIFQYDSEAPGELKAVIHITRDNGIWVDMRDSIGDITYCRIYVDGHMIYNGTEMRHHLNLSGEHVIRGEVVDSSGRMDFVEIKLSKEERKFVFSPLYLIPIIIAVFLYKVWKDHG